MPHSLWVAAARLLAAGVDVADLQDANIRPVEKTEAVIGTSLLGAPYIPEVIKQIIEPNPQARVIVGGQVVNGLTRSQFKRLFGRRAINGNDDAALARAFGIRPSDLPPVSKTSLIPVYELVSDEDMEKYLSHEFSFFLSQGCRFACTFCAAVRTVKDPFSGRVTKATEEYRDMRIVEKDLRYLVQRAERLGIGEITLYLSNLDIFQTPHKLEQFADVVLKIRKNNPHFSIRMRGLATADSFIAVHRKNPTVIRKLVDAGLCTVGFGVDGATPEVWRSVHKGHNSQDKCLESIRVAREEYGITPEILMVFGHPAETEDSLKTAVAFTRDMVEKYQAVPRPYIAKDIVPGNDYWRMPKNRRRISALIKHPEYFQALDFAALPSSVSHPNKKLRALATQYYLEILDVAGNTTEPIYPVAPETSTESAQRMNEGKYDG